MMPLVVFGFVVTSIRSLVVLVRDYNGDLCSACAFPLAPLRDKVDIPKSNPPFKCPECGTSVAPANGHRWRIAVKALGITNLNSRF